MNICILQGRPTADLELKTTASGKSVVSFGLAVKRPFTKDTTDFINCVAFEKKAEIMSNYIGKGTLINVQGLLQSRKYDDKNGVTRTVFEVVVNDFDFCEKKNADATSNDELDTVKKNLENLGFSNSKSGDFENLIDDDDNGDLPF